MKVELKVREGGVVSPARQLLSTLRQALSTMSLYCVKVSLKLRADAALASIDAQTTDFLNNTAFFIRVLLHTLYQVSVCYLLLENLAILVFVHLLVNHTRSHYLN